MTLQLTANYATRHLFVQVVIGKVELYFSYNTLIAFNSPTTGLVVSQNEWSATTGKHLNLIDGGSKDRVTPAEFARLLHTLPLPI